MDPAIIIGAVATALSTVAGLLYRELLRRAEAAEQNAIYWRDRAILSQGLSELSTDEAERRRKP